MVDPGGCCWGNFSVLWSQGGRATLSNPPNDGPGLGFLLTFNVRFTSGYIYPPNQCYLAPTWLKQNLKLKVSATDCASTKPWDISLYGHIYDLASINQVANRLIRISNISATWWHAQLICCIVITKLWVFFGPWGQDCCHLKTLFFSGKTNTAIHDPKCGLIHGDPAIIWDYLTLTLS